MPAKAASDKPKSTAEGDADGAAAEAAITEVRNETKADAVVSGSVAGVDFSFKHKRLRSLDFRELMQQGRDILALRHLFGEITWNDIKAALRDEDGDIPPEGYLQIWDAVNGAAKEGNS